jgi:N-acetylglucosamine-6-sulfatase
LNTRAGLLCPLILALHGGGCGGSASTPTPLPTPTASPLARPNLVLVLTDDLDVRTAELLPRLPSLMSQPGLTFSRAYVTTSLCAPSRASLLTGRYAHNSGVLYNSGPQGGFPAFRAGAEAQTVAVWLKAAGYRTALFGKYLNDYPGNSPPEYIPAGWDDWQVQLTSFENARYYNYEMNENGRVVAYGNRPEDYDADVLARKAVDFIQKTAAEPAKPFFLLVATQAPHTPANYAARHAGQPSGDGAARVPSFNEGDVSDKPAWVQNTPLLTEKDIRKLDQFQQARVLTLLAVEELLDQILRTLIATGRIGNTYVFFTSDNGLLLGEHRLADRKANAFEEAILVPLIVRGPGTPAGQRVALPVLNLDLAPTFAELAGLAVPDAVDGRSLVPFLRGNPPDPARWRTDFLVEHFSAGVSLSVRNPDVLYTDVESGERELYDMRNDPYQLVSFHRKADPDLLARLSARATALSRCRGASCRE